MFGMLCNSSLGINTIWFISFSVCFLSFSNFTDGGKQLKNTSDVLNFTDNPLEEFKYLSKYSFYIKYQQLQK